MTISKFINIPVTDPEDVRQKKLLNMLLAILAISSVVQAMVERSILLLQLPIHPPLYDPEFTTLMNLGFPIAIALYGIVFLINRYWSVSIAKWFFIIVLAISVYANTPDDWMLATLTYGLSIPIFIASFLFAPFVSFALAGVSSLIVTIAGILLETGVYVTPIFNFFSTGMLSWFTARTLRSALADLRILNLELDQRVQDRTRELAESLSKTEAILESTADGIIVFDDKGKATVANPAVACLIALPVAEIVNSDIRTLMGDNVSSDDKEVIDEFLHGKEMQEPSIKFEWGKKILSASAAPVHLESGENLGTVAVFRDFTQEAEIDRMKSTFVSLASHELRTPLNAIMGYAELLHEEVYGTLSERQQDATKRILANTNHMLSLASNLLDRAQIEAGTLELNIIDFSPAKVVSEAVNAMEILARNKELELTSEATDDVPNTVIGDRQRVNQVVVNLIGNALKFTKEGGVHVCAYSCDENNWAVDVTDTGIGIPKEAQEYIFEPFRQADESATREQGGAGLGLSIVKQLVEMMGGVTKLKSEVGKGSTFTIVLPLTPPSPENQEDKK